MTRRFWRITGRKSLKNLALHSGEVIKPGDNELQVEVRCVGLNFADIFACHGLYSATPKGDFTPGLEFSGVVVATGAECMKYETGDTVMGVSRFGAYSSHVNIPEDYVWPIPEGWNFKEAAAFPVQALTAAYALFELGNLKKNHKVLVHSAAGGVGLMALDIISKSGAYAISTVGNRDKKEFLTRVKGLPNSAVMVRERDFAGQLDRTLKQLQYDGLDIVLDGIGGKLFKPAFQRLNPQGRHIQFGAAVLAPKGMGVNYPKLIANYLHRPKIDPLEMINRNRSVMCFNLIWLWEQVEELRGLVERLFEMKPERPYVGHEFDFSEAVEALNTFQKGGTMGKVILSLG